MIHFESYEFDSPDQIGSGDKMDASFLQMLDDARGIAGIPFKITSGYRTQKHLQSLIDKGYKASKNSSHLVGKAADISVTNGLDRYIVLNALIKAGFKRIGISSNFIHCDNDSIDLGGAKNNSVWVY